jgi:hypothetical protein
MKSDEEHRTRRAVRASLSRLSNSPDAIEVVLQGPGVVAIAGALTTAGKPLWVAALSSIKNAIVQKHVEMRIPTRTAPAVSVKVAGQ